jgi:hypothetical protein
MGNLDSMTKAELLDEAERRGIDVDSTATKAEIRALVDAEQGVEGQATTTATKDYMGRALITPAINSKDYMGRATFSAVDYMGRQLVL